MSFELAQKAAVTGAPILVGVGAPSSLAISLADDRWHDAVRLAGALRVSIDTQPQRAGCPVLAPRDGRLDRAVVG